MRSRAVKRLTPWTAPVVQRKCGRVNRLTAIIGLAVLAGLVAAGFCYVRPRLASANADPVTQLVREGDTRVRASDWPGAAASYEKALALKSKDPVLLRKLADVRFARGDFNGGVEACGALLELRPDDVVYRSKWQIGLEQIRRARGNGIRLAWLTFDEYYGGKPPFLRAVDE